MRRIIAVLLAVACLTAAVCMVLTASAAGSYLLGDADGDGTVTLLDATVIQRKLARLSVPSYHADAADVDGDGLNIIDATLIQCYLAGFENTYHIDEPVAVPDPTEPTISLDPYELPAV